MDPLSDILRRFRYGPTCQELLRIEALAADVSFMLDVDKFASTLPTYFPFLEAFLRQHQCINRNVVLPRPGAIPRVVSDGYLSNYDSDPVAPRLLGVSGERGESAKPPKTLNLFLIRHGEYVDTVAKGMVGHLNPALSEAGLQQAADLSVCVSTGLGGGVSGPRSQGVDLVVCSPLRRAALTAELIAYPHALTPQIDTDLLAIDRGDWSGLPLREVESYFPGDWDKWCTDPNYSEHGGESYGALMARVKRALEKIIRRVLLSTEFEGSLGAGICVRSMWPRTPRRSYRTSMSDQYVVIRVILSCRTSDLHSVQIGHRVASQMTAESCSGQLRSVLWDICGVSFHGSCTSLDRIIQENRT